MSYFNPVQTSDITYTSAFPPLQAFPWGLAVSNNKKNHATSTSSSISSNTSGSSSLTTTPVCFFHSLTPPKYPLYLKYTVYADLILQQYNDSKTKKVISDPIDLHLPHSWNKMNKIRHQLLVGINGYDLSYTISGQAKKETIPSESTTLHTNCSIKPHCGVYYFEIRVLQKGQDGAFAIGFGRESHQLNKLPGCESHSYGYHGQDGLVYQHGTKGINYGPSFSSGDVVGCCINFASNTAFFTKNGVSLGNAFTAINITEPLYPCVGLGTPGEKVTANFGQEPFLFDIVQYVKTEKVKLTQEITAHQEPMEVKNKYKHDIKAETDQLVLSYLLQHGYTQAAKALQKNISQVKQTKQPTLLPTEEEEVRNNIRKSIMSGAMDTAVEQTQKSYPGLLENDPSLLFQLKKQKFLDILIEPHHPTSDHSSSSDDTDDDTNSTYSGRSRTQSFNGGGHHYEEDQPCSLGHMDSPPLPVAASGRRLSWAAIAAPPSFDTTVIEEMFTTKRKSFSGRTRRDSMCSIEFEEEDSKKMTMIRRAMHYGHQLQEEYKSNAKQTHALVELFTLLAYHEPKSSPMAHLLDLTQRDTVATELNKAIKKHLNHAQESRLELLYKQSMVTSKALVCSGHGKASLLNIKHYFQGE